MVRVKCCGHLISDLLVKGAKRFARIHPQVGVGYFLVYSFLLVCFVCFEGVANDEQNAGLCGMRAVV